MRNLIIIIALLLLVLMLLPSYKLDSREKGINRCREIMEGYNLTTAVEACLNDIIKRESEK